LLVDLERALRDIATFTDSQQLLTHLMPRHDLLATVANDVDELPEEPDDVPVGAILGAIAGVILPRIRKTKQA
jgi:hypothetical protein